MYDLTLLYTFTSQKMRLLKTSTYKLHDLYGEDSPYYAILSHRRKEEEVGFEDMENNRAPNFLGWSKIEIFCA